MFLFFILPTMAEESPTQEVVLSEDIPLFTDVGLDSGWVPNSGSLSVRLELLANGNMMVEETGSAQLLPRSCKVKRTVRMRRQDPPSAMAVSAAHQ